MVFDVPTVVKTSDRNIKAHINDSKTLQCQFNAPTMKDVTIVVWTKDDMAINSSDHYRITTFTKPGIDNLIVSDLTINNITAADQGKFSCYCYYNRALVTSSKSVVSEEQSFTIYFKRRGYLTYYMTMLCYITVFRKKVSSRIYCSRYSSRITTVIVGCCQHACHVYKILSPLAQWNVG